MTAADLQDLWRAYDEECDLGTFDRAYPDPRTMADYDAYFRDPLGKSWENRLLHRWVAFLASRRSGDRVCR